jgi:uncharacterized membrane protein
MAYKPYIKKTFKILMVLHIVLVFLCLVRFLYYGQVRYLFIPWNLLLAWLPIIFISIVNKKRSKITSAILLFLWFIFYPNSLYMITDLGHPIVVHRATAFATQGSYYPWLNFMSKAIVQLDVVLMFILSIIGCLLSVLSIKILLTKYKIAKKHYAFGSIMLSLLTAFAIFLGRSLRLNSWEIFSNPIGLFSKIFNSLLSSQVDILMYMIIFGILNLVICYVVWPDKET